MIITFQRKIISLLLVGYFFANKIQSLYATPYEVRNPNSLIPSFGSNQDGMVTGIAHIITYLIGISTILGVIGVTWGGITMVMAAGSDETVKKGRWIMIYSIIGTIVSAGAYAIITWVGNISL